MSDGKYTTSYAYDALNQLVRENDQRAGKTYTYSYSNGNITSRKEYAYTTGTLGSSTGSKSWTYGDGVWKDLLTNYNGTAITYDTIGNPTKIGAKTLTWEGGRLTKIADGSKTYSYAYNGDGQRVSKTVNGTKTEYYYNGSILAGQKTGSNTLVFMYDSNGDPFGFKYNNTEYYYVKNAQNDVTAITDSAGKVIANYYYDAWGKLLSVTDANGKAITASTNVAIINPIRYRSYYYDTETGYYYLSSRYYSPDMCRFLNADEYVQTGQGMLDKNMFAYCENNPVVRADYNGQIWHIVIGAAVGAAVGVLGQLISDGITSIINGELTISDWQTYVGAGVGGVVGGAILGGTGNISLANVATGFVTTGVGLSLEKVTGVSDKSWSEIGINSVVDGAISYGLGKLPGIRGVTKGKNSNSSIFRSGLTKLRNGTASHMSNKVIFKGVVSIFVGGLAMDSYYGVKQSLYNCVKTFLKKLFS